MAFWEENDENTCKDALEAVSLYAHCILHNSRRYHSQTVKVNNISLELCRGLDCYNPSQYLD